MEYDIWLYIFVPLVAFFYASVGHGGASGYLALMALFAVPVVEMRSSALLLNICVSAIAFYQYARAGNMLWRLFFLVTIGSIPASFLGGMMQPDPGIYRKLLGFFLMFPVIRFAGFTWKVNQQPFQRIPDFTFVILGIGIGWVSGMIGIGGGILLSPVLLLLGVADLKETATVSALFITVNSIAGLAGNALGGLVFTTDILILLGLAIGAGTIGAYVGARLFNTRQLRMLLAVVLLLAALKLMMT